MCISPPEDTVKLQTSFAVDIEQQSARHRYTRQRLGAAPPLTVSFEPDAVVACGPPLSSTKSAVILPAPFADGFHLRRTRPGLASSSISRASFCAIPTQRVRANRERQDSRRRNGPRTLRISTKKRTSATIRSLPNLTPAAAEPSAGALPFDPNRPVKITHLRNTRHRTSNQEPTCDTCAQLSLEKWSDYLGLLPLRSSGALCSSSNPSLSPKCSCCLAPQSKLRHAGGS
ncbi:hypothetical protein BDV95DRAFT_597891 [Massariosphaeria phaeospora]|uniref:Uncharacterized protein n=1 Tax=Massariosphaeria phaeospora TaxID=100035 RepID=A0A7C8M228_9PLEO|nr:hypothetical protein BDV95DRAFT_597891 [Massariosphaeria phaeospora]